MKKNLIIIGSPLQLINAVEAVHFFKLENIVLVITFNGLLINNIQIEFKRNIYGEIEETEEEIKQKIHHWALNNNEILITKQNLNILFKEESFKLSEHIYNAHSQELNTPLFKLYLDKNKKTISFCHIQIFIFTP